MSLSELLGNVGLFGGLVMCCLALLSIFSVGVIFDKQRRYRQASRQSQTYRPLYEKALRAGEVKGALEAFKAHQDSYVAQVVSSGLMHYETAKEHGTDRDTQLEIVTSALEHRKIEAMIELRRGLGWLATIGSTAPFIGLFGTVVGIIMAFEKLGTAGKAAAGAASAAASADVMSSIAEALVATAIGLFAAIPAVIAYNRFARDIDRTAIQLETFIEEFSNILQRNVGAAAAQGV